MFYHHYRHLVARNIIPLYSSTFVELFIREFSLKSADNEEQERKARYSRNLKGEIWKTMNSSCSKTKEKHDK